MAELSDVTTIVALLILLFLMVGIGWRFIQFMHTIGKGSSWKRWWPNRPPPAAPPVPLDLPAVHNPAAPPTGTLKRQMHALLALGAFDAAAQLYQHTHGSSAAAAQAATEALHAAQPAPTSPDSAAVVAELRDLLWQDKLLQAAHLLRQQGDLSLAEARDALTLIASVLFAAAPPAATAAATATDPAADTVATTAADARPDQRLSVDDLHAELRELLRLGGSALAVHTLRERTGASQATAEQVIAALAAENAATMGSHTAEPLEAEILELLDDDRKLEAVKCYRSRRQVDLKRAKEAVEALQEARIAARLTPTLAAELRALLAAEHQARAIQRYREQTGSGFREAMQVVTRLTEH